MTKDTGVIPSLQEEEIKRYLHEVLVELGKIKGKDRDGGESNLRGYDNNDNGNNNDNNDKKL